MNASIHMKKVPFFEATLGYVFFKNLEIAELNLFFESLSELFYSEECSPIAVLVQGDNRYQKTWKKTTDRVFDESNWITTWIQSPENDRHLSGYFTVLSDANLKSLISDTFNLKVFDTPNTRFCLVGNIQESERKLSAGEELKRVGETLASSLAFCGLEPRNVVRQSLWMPSYANKEWVVNHYNTVMDLNPQPLETVSCYETYSQDSDPILASAMALHNKAQNIQVQPLNLAIGHSMKGVKLSGFGMEYVMVNPFQLASSENNADNCLEEKLVQFSQTLATLDLDWNHMVRGVVFASGKDGIKAFKNACKELKIPLASMNFISSAFKNKTSQWTLECDFYRSLD